MEVVDTVVSGDRIYEFVRRQVEPKRAFDDGMRVGIRWTSMDGTETGVISGLYPTLEQSRGVLDRMLAE